MKKKFKNFVFKLFLLFAIFAFQKTHSQTNTQSGSQSGCTRSPYFLGTVSASSGTAFVTLSNYGPGYYFRIPVLQGAYYSVSTCGASIDTQINCFQGNATTGPFAYNDDNGPECSGTAASVDMVPNFTDYAGIDVRQYACQPGGSASINVYIRQNNNLAFTSSSADMCSGQTRALTAVPITVTVTPLTGSGDVGTFTGTGVSGGVFTAPVVSSPTNYTITYTFGYVSQTQVITVNPLPTLSASATNSVICNGGATTLNGSGASTYTWTGGVTNGTPFGPGSTTSYSLTGTSAAGCASSNTVVQTITVNPLPSVTANAVPTVVCSGNTSILNGSGATSYIWTGGVTNGVSFTPGSTTTYTVIGTQASTGCTNTAVQTVSVNPLPILTAAATNSVICNGATTTLNGGGANTYTWTGGVTNGVSFTPGTTTAYSVTGTSAAGCLGSSAAVVTVTVNPLPLVTANATNSVICNGGSSTLNGGGASTYTWTGGVTNGVAFNPSSTTSYSVTGTSAAGCTSTNSAVQTISVNALPIVSSTVSNSVICNGFSTTLNGSGASTYTWTGGATNGVSFSPSSTTSYSLTGTNAAGCTSTNSAVQTITVNPLPVVTAATSNSVICNGATTTLNGGGANTYTWTGGVTNGTPFSPSVTTTYSVTGTSAAGCLSSNTAVRTITVNPLPIVTASTSNSVICFGANTTLNGGGASTYTWTGGVTNGVSFSPNSTMSYSVTGTSAAGCLSSNTAVQAITVNTLPIVASTVSNSVVCNGFTTTLNGSGALTYTWTGGASNGTPFSPSITTTYSLSGTNAAGCTSTNSAVQTITVNQLPSVSSSVTNSVICFGETTILSGSGANTYTWTDGVLDGTAFSPTVTTTYSLIGTSSAGCTSTNTSVQTITVNALPVISVTNATICVSASATLSASGAVTYTWNTGAQTSTLVVNPTSTTLYTITGTDANNCVNTESTSVTVVAIPIITANSATICEGATAVLVANGVTTYTWSNSANTNSISITPATSTVYTVSGELAGCTVPASPVTVSVSVNPLPIITATTNLSVMCSGETANLNLAGGITYTVNGIVTAATSTISPPTTTTYSIVGTDANGCSNFSTFIQEVSECTGVAKSTAVNSSIKIYPNPNNGEFTISSTSNVDLKILNELGQVVQKLSLDELNNHSVGVKNIANGIYFIVGKNNNVTISQKIIVSK